MPLARAKAGSVRAMFRFMCGNSSEGAGGPGRSIVASAVPAGRLINEKSQVVADRKVGAVDRADARHDDHGMRNAAPRPERAPRRSAARGRACRATPESE